MTSTDLSPYRFIFVGIVFLISVLFLCDSLSNTVRFFFLIDRFTVNDSHLECQQPLNNRCTRHYSIDRGKGAKDDFVPFGSQFESSDLTTGVIVEKDAYGFAYKIDRSDKRWPFLYAEAERFSMGCFGLAAIYFVGGYRVLRSWARAFLARLKLPNGVIDRDMEQ